jgi:orotate phosphoribosyltransferase
MSANAFLDELERVGALKSGHFLLASGRHSGQYVEKFNLLRNPRATERACTTLIESLGQQRNVDLIVGPTTGGVILAFEVGRQLDLPAAFAERVSEGGSARAIKRDTFIARGTRVLVVDDILTTGGSVRETLEALRPWGADVRAVAVLVDRSGGRIDFGVPLIANAQLDIETWDAAECPLCASGTPLVKPGSTAVPGS